MNKGFLFLISLTLIIVFACNESEIKKSDVSISEEIEDSIAMEDTVQAPDTIIPIEGIRRVFYDLVSPVELTEFVMFSKSTFNHNILNSTNNVTKYSTNIKHALNMGVYGTDLIYCRMFNQKQDAIKYLAVIKSFTEELGIPKDEISKTLGSAENYIDKRDSLFGLIKDAFTDADKYLNSNDRANVAALIYFGTWVEALHIATNIYQDPDADKKAIGLHIAQQKFALNNILKLLSRDFESPDISHYTVLVKRLKRIYDGIDIVIDDKKSQIDTFNKTIIINADKTVVTPEQVEEISVAVRRIRGDIIG